MNIQRQHVSSDLRLRSSHRCSLHLLPLLLQIGQVQVVIHKIVTVEGKARQREANTHKTHQQTRTASLSPLPCAEVDHEESLLLKGVNMMKEVES